ncbi:Response regulator protein TodT [Labrys miyagiensis]
MGFTDVSKVQIVSIVDDDESVRTAMEGLVRSLGFVACTFGSAEDFLSSPQAEATDCLITDVQMPGMSGLELQNHLRARGSRMPVIFITAYPERNVRQRAEAAGAIAFLEKPSDGGVMAHYLNQALGHR